MADYDRDVQQLVGYYKRSLRELESILMRIDLTDGRRAVITATMREIIAILRALDQDASDWVERNIPKAIRDGAVVTFASLGLASDIPLGRLNREAIALAVADTQADLLAITQNVERKVRNGIRTAMAEASRSNMTQGINGVRTIRADFLANAREILGASLNTGIIDASGRRWKPDVYANTVVRTKMAQVHRDAAINEAIPRGALYGQISRHGATDACANWEGRIVKLTPDAPGNYPYIGNISRRQLFHPQCRHTVTPLRDPNRS